MLTLEQAGRLYGVPLTDYGEARGRGLLVSSGCGMMMAIMDECTTLRWCVDLDSVRGGVPRLSDFLQMAERLADPIGITGWFSISDPEPLRAAILAMARPPLVYGGNIRFGAGVECETLGELTARIRSASPRERMTATP